MNRKFILFLSILIIATGITGILVNNDSHETTSNELLELNSEKYVNIALAQSTRDLSSGKTLSKNDYAIKKLLVKESSELAKNNISSSAEINSHILKENVLANSYLTKDMLASPDSDEFNRLTLKKGEIIYKFNLKNKMNIYSIH